MKPCPVCGCLPIEWLSTGQVAAVLKITDRTVRNRIACGDMEATQFGMVWRVRHSTLDAYIERRASLA